MRVKDYRFIKPAEHALIDLLNKTYSTDFAPSELEIQEIEPVTQTQTSSVSLIVNAQAKIKFVAMGDNIRGTRWYKYRRMTLSSFIPLSYRFMSEDVVNDELFIDTMLTRFLVNILHGTFSWSVETDANAVRTYILSATDDNPVWIGSVAIICVSNTQLAAIDLANEGGGDDEEEPPVDNGGTITNSILGGEYTFTQTVPSDAWYIEHNLDCHPSVTVIDTTGDDIVGSITYLSKNILQIVFSSPMQGIAILR